MGNIKKDYKIADYKKFYLDDEIKENNIAATLLKVQERKTAKGNSYAVLKLTDLTSVFELYIFSDILELNRQILKNYIAVDNIEIIQSIFYLR